MATSAERKETRGSEGVPAHLLFVMLAPRFPPTYPPEAILENMTIEPILKLNIRLIVAMHPNWRVIVDNDKICIERIELAISDGLFSDRMSTYWWWNLETQQKWPAFRSDLCRLVQLHYDGGMYVARRRTALDSRRCEVQVRSARVNDCATVQRIKRG